jgi:fucose 4-O-acetylase-like acetyltransferase
MTNSTERHQYWDIMKGLGIVAVVVGHSGSPLTPFVYTYHLALFFFISGCLYKDTYSETPVVYIAKRMKSLYWPFVKYGIIFLMLHNVFLYFNILSAKVEPGIITTKEYHIRDMVRMAEDILTLITTEDMVGAMWFIPLLFITCILFCIIRYISIRFAGRHSLLATGGISIILFAIGIIFAQKNVILSRHADVAFVVLPILFVGYLFNNFKLQRFLHWGIVFCCTIYLIFVSRKYGVIQIDRRVYINPWIFITASFAGIYVNLYLGKIIQEISFLGEWVAYIGRKSLMIMACHFLAFKTVSFLYIFVNEAPEYWIAKFPVIYGINGWWIAYAITGIGIPLAFNEIVESFSERLHRKRGVEVSA